MSAGRTIIAAIAAIAPSAIARLVLNAAGHDVARGCQIGLSWIDARKITMSAGATIGHLNVLRIDDMTLGERARIGHMNRLTGPYDVSLGRSSVIGNRNLITRSRHEVYGRSELSLGEISGITADHRLDLTCSIIFGDFTTVAGSGTQLWTHGYVHDRTGPGRYRIDGGIRIGSNVYIGTASFISMGVTIADGIIVGGGSSVARDLLEAGLYVSAPIRQINRPAPPSTRADLEQLETGEGEIVYRKVGAARDRTPL